MFYFAQIITNFITVTISERHTHYTNVDTRNILGPYNIFTGTYYGLSISQAKLNISLGEKGIKEQKVLNLPILLVISYQRTKSYLKKTMALQVRLQTSAFSWAWGPFWDAGAVRDRHDIESCHLQTFDWRLKQNRRLSRSRQFSIFDTKKC